MRCGEGNPTPPPSFDAIDEGDIEQSLDGAA